MKNLLLPLLAFMGLFLIRPFAEAQSLEGLFKKKIMEEIEKDAKNKKQTKTEKADSINVQRKEDKVIIQNDDSTVTISEDKEAKVLGPNEYIGSFEIEMFFFDKKGNPDTKEPMVMYYAFDKWFSAFENKSLEDNDENMRMVFSLKDEKMYMLMTDKKGNKTGIVRKMPHLKVDYTGKEAEKDYVLTKTSETKMIDGHLCTKYVSTYSNNRVESWIAADLPFGYYKNFAMFSASVNNKTASNNPDLEKMADVGMPLEMHVYENDKKTTEMHVNNVNNNTPSPVIFSTQGYELQDLSTLGNIFGEQ